jgi:hypothetical protein
MGAKITPSSLAESRVYAPTRRNITSTPLGLITGASRIDTDELLR